jgi:hypothetical protein
MSKVVPRRARASKTAVTTAARFAQREPRLPHEHDESSDQQASVNDSARVVGRQAADDLARGLVDTDRGPVLERIRKDHFGPAKRTRRPRG